MHMGTVSGLQMTTGSSSRGEELTDSKLTDLNDWFTWCQTCSHGGHTDHIKHWFR